MGSSGKGHQRDAARYAGLMAQAQEAEARSVRNQTVQYGQQALNELRGISNPSVEELRSLEGQLQSSERVLAQNERLLSAVDPALMEASQQALKLLRGEKAQSLGPLEQQRTEQRNQLVQRLREQYGPGAESTSAGAKALRQFDSETSMLSNSAQQQSLGTLLGTTEQARSSALGGIQLGYNGYGTARQGYGDIANRQAQAIGSGYSQLMSGYLNSSQPVIGSSGSKYTEGVAYNQARASANQWTQGQLWNLGSQMAGAAMGGMFGMPSFGGGGGGGQTISGQSYSNYGNMA